MKKRDVIFITIIIILLISLVATIIYYNKDKVLTTEGEILIVGSNYLLVGTKDNEDYVIKTKDTNYQVGDKIKLELKKINKKKTPYEATAKNITIIEENSNQENNNENISDNNQSSVQENTSNNESTTKPQTNTKPNNNQNIVEDNKYSEQQIITYFEDLNNEITNYDNSNESLGKTIKSKFVKCIDFIFYDEEIGGRTFKELTNATKLKILEIAMTIDSKIESKFPGYKESINTSYQNIKSKVIEKYLEITTNICNNEPELCITAKENFNDLKENFDITWELIKDLANNGVSKLKDWYEIWRYN